MILQIVSVILSSIFLAGLTQKCLEEKKPKKEVFKYGKFIKLKHKIRFN